MGSGKNNAEYLANLILKYVEITFQDEPIQPKQKPKSEKLPSLLQAARSLEKGPYQDPYRLFLKQAKLLVNYQDTYPLRYLANRDFPSYRSLDNQELRVYFSWRTKVRQGDIQDCGDTCGAIYLFELMNHVGADSAEDGLQKMDAFVDSCTKANYLIHYYYPNWRTSYILYYGLPAERLREALGDQEIETALDILDTAPEQEDAAIMKALRTLSSGWLGYSGFYKKHTQDMDTVISQVMRRMQARYRSRGQRDLSEQLFSSPQGMPFSAFLYAMFCQPLKWRSGVYKLSPKHYFVLSDNGCEEVRRTVTDFRRKKLNELLKYIDSEMRAATGGTRLKALEKRKWVDAIIQEEIQALLTKKNEKQVPKLTIDYGALKRIRQDAALTQEKLRIEDELEEPEEAPAPVSPAPEPENDGCPLNADEQRLMRCLLYGGDTGWVQREGKILSVLSDSINDKLYDVFQDSVLADDQIVEDYLDELKEIVKP